MSNLTRAMMMGAAGASGDKVYVEDVFSTFLYEGTSTNVSINNGLDLDGEGGLVWLKKRNGTGDNLLYDTDRYAVTQNTRLISNTNGAELSGYGNDFGGFNNNGFDVKFNMNASGSTYTSWTFRKAPGFFDVVTYTGTGSNRTIAHSLGSVPGMIIVKCTSSGSTNWLVYHRSLGATKAGVLDLTNTPVTSVGPWNNTAPTSTVFTVGVSNDVNSNGDTYVAYIFAHDDQSFGTNSNEAIIKCGGFTGANHAESLGFEPQWLLVKKTSTNAGADWIIVDNMRGFFPNGTDSIDLHPNTDDDEYVSPFHITSDGFYYSSSSATYIYMAIRRPHKPPTAGTDVFLPAAVAGNSDITTGFPVDLAFQLRRTTGSKAVVTRLTGKNSLETRNTNAETFNANAWYESNTQLLNTGLFSADSAFHLFKRAPGFLDVVGYTGTGSATTVSHNLGVVPELMILKRRSLSGSWNVYTAALGSTKHLDLDTNSSFSTNPFSWDNTAPTSSVFTAGSNNSQSSSTYINYLFATLNGISKVGTYTGTGNAINVDCGFSAGARYILIKRTDSSGDWFVYDTARGIVSGNDPYLLLNDSAGDVTNTDYIDPLNSGFTVTSSAPTGLNASGGTYIFLAIA